MSKPSTDKAARRKKRRAARDERWISDTVLNELSVTDVVNVAAELELFDQRVTERGWTFDDEQSDDDFAIWFYEPSGAEVGGDGVEPVTTVWMFAGDDGELVHVVLVGTADEQLFTPEGFFEQIEAIESYRIGDPHPPAVVSGL
jgi:hypothetical protein